MEALTRAVHRRDVPKQFATLCGERIAHAEWHAPHAGRANRVLDAIVQLLSKA